MLWQTAVIIWRELVEALLVIGILHAWLVHEAGETGRSRGTLYLWGGVVAGVAAAVALGAVLVFAENLFGELAAPRSWGPRLRSPTPCPPPCSS